MCVCNCVRLIKWASITVVVGALFIAVVNYWLENKSYVFQAEDIARLTNEALTATKGGLINFLDCSSLRLLRTNLL